MSTPTAPAPPAAEVPLRDRILDAAHELVLARGFSATSVADVLAEVGASKGAFFHHFPSKAALGYALVERYARGDATILEEHLALAEAAVDDPAGQVVAFVRSFEDAAGEHVMEQPGCLFVSFVYEQVPETGDIRQLVVESVELWRRRILDKLEQAATVGRVPDGVDLPSLADQVFTVFEGAFILARATGDPDHVRAQLAHLRRYLELLLDVPSRPTGAG